MKPLFVKRLAAGKQFFARRSNRRTFALMLSVSLGVAANSAQAQGTANIFLSATPSSVDLHPGDTLSLVFALNVQSLQPGDSYLSASGYFEYAQAAGSTTPVSPFSSASLTAATSAQSGFANATLDQAARTITYNNNTYTGFIFRANNGQNARTDTGAFPLANATATLRPDLAPGDYTFNFFDAGLGSGSLARTFVTGTFANGSGGTVAEAAFNPGPNSIPLGGNAVTIHVTIAPVPEASSVILLSVGLGTLGVLHRRSQRKQQGAVPLVQV